MRIGQGKNDKKMKLNLNWRKTLTNQQKLG
jgi:hypothetical protein